MRPLAYLLTGLMLALPVLAQTKGEAKTQLRKMTRAAKSDVDLLVAAGKFASEHGLLKERKKLITRILKLDEDNQWANEALGKIKHEGKWLERKDYDSLIAKQLEAKYKAQGMLLVEGVWVKKENAADAKRGVFHHDGRLVNKWEKQQLLQGHVRHPRTGRFIKAADLEKAEKGLFPLPDGRWVDLEAANKFHKKKRSPWVIRTYHAYIMTNVPLEEIDKGENNVVLGVDGAIGRVLKLFGSKEAPPARRPVIRLASTIEEYKDLGEQFGGGGSVYGVFHNERVRVRVDGTEAGMTVMNYGEKDWRPYFAKHAGAMATSFAFCGAQAGKVPLWFHRGVATYAERVANPGHAKFFGKQQDGRGGIPKLDKFFDRYQINSDIDNQAVNGNLFVAGFLIHFALQGGDKEVTDTMLKVTAAFEKGAKLSKPIAALEKALIRKQEAVRAQFKKILQ